ncbi:4-hydroxythreonine-4-phosphate dehydrogenase PdxA [Undibacterium sp. RTI2.1]|uniref:4-hydroxythreonine-4-phosphate dehydrogenase PdxA n=1 Tax=unclassified Undibacterium TaxID=2630295 RepID=UPI002AB4696A|nr:MULTISPECIES: 4-hydroxythreonine-4-phosphate dehydrogenase PdxA [unclassified Undibacterium]MDY7536665.1 4-hydroxythreonine-4-phosphate dehydrogenase PdxA [Undibacterium sp. 5I1]MEB0032365.1 4-hydroxythreonine-4-phosphate dehydrogenase PdxA [Undibacterium sp. RTI2.1]MEB0118463.1 4-hydroxythreonine-4-phosphate dehydrogenase PdxA [Undibacterium sp. RTI2.2]MEB0230290.1 4-hydroxythreonine-4-phosphate dehydrogenase PdxA [Undibacterium sp. 10I3]MEB0257990.1 4-hydroxythreonine-4-phosphate dehydrog
MTKIAITVGEPAGIGPEVSLLAAWQLRSEIRPVLIGDAAYLSMLAGEIDPAMQLMGVSLEALRYTGLPACGVNQITVIDCPLAAHVIAGQLDPRNGRSVLHTLDVAIESVQQAWCDAIVTAPLQKSTINDAGVAFSGHTEYFAEKTNTAQVVMMLACEASDHLPHALRVALATTHLALKDVPAAITFDHLLKTLQIIHQDLQVKFGLQQPRIFVTGLNPHAGENGYLGREEIDIITPVILHAQGLGMDVRGPYPADTLFQQKYLQEADCVLAMYHDQGLPVLKHASFGLGVNITLGLPLIRTSVDHGTALDLAAQGVGKADVGSMLVAVRVAAGMVKAQSQH